MNRWKIMDNVFILSIGLMIFFAWMDVKQITSFFMLNNQYAWSLYHTYTGPAIWSMWTAVFIVIGLIWYLIYKDKSEAVALSLSLYLLNKFGVQDLFYFIFSQQTLSEVGCWANGMWPVRIVSQLMGENCPVEKSFLVSAILGIFVTYFVYKKLQRAKW